MPQSLTVELDGMTGATGIAYLMGGYALDTQNVLGKPETIVPREKAVSFKGNVFQWTVPPESVCIFRLHGTHIIKEEHT